MNDENDGRVSDETAPITTTPAAAPVVESKPRFRDRLWGLRALIAVALASVIVGGLGGAAIASMGDHHDRGRFGPGRFGPGGPGMGGPGGGQGFNRGPGQGRGFGNGNGGPGQMPQNQQQAPTPPATPSASPTT